ncbi:hypothetical protein M407DRAFT_26034 [Tulasnella calospora MUT 4182]|uniref:Copper transporter n=1 Tax=Tulasnella calospora MUT 4182 TaxID=1051891 RepID=A0A0C3QF10_9AGAM|nr:hypothetical protein M407DRAFT_26034 [Tulasnella calospora MUT 4182]
MNSASQATESSGFTGGLHFGFHEDTLLFGGLQLTSWTSFIVGILLTSTICLFERFITLLLSSKTLPARCRIDGCPFRTALLRTSLYALATLLRLAYMLLSMTMHIGIILTIVFSLSVGQFCIEYRQASPSSASGGGNRPGFYTPLPLYPSSNAAEGGSWDGSRDKANQIMLGVLPPSSGNSRSVTPTAGTTSGPLSSQLFDPRRRGNGQAAPRYSPTSARAPGTQDISTPLTSPIQRRQTSGSSLGRSGGSLTGLQRARGSGSTLTPNNSAGVRRPLFQIGSSGDDRTSDSE